MHFDDRLATVLRHRAAGARAARTQYRQLLDLLDEPRAARDNRLLGAAWLRLGALGEEIPAAERAAILREPSLRITSAELAAHLADDEPDVAAAALAGARLGDDDWEALIPRLPVRARGFLRLRRDLPERVRAILDRLGIHDRGLPVPDAQASVAQVVEAAPDQSSLAEQAQEPSEESEIGQLVRRIERFRQARSDHREGAAADHFAPRLPLNDRPVEADRGLVRSFAFTANGQGRIDWAEGTVAPAVTGYRLADMGANVADALRRRQPIAAAAVDLEGAPAIAGRWVVLASPRFAEEGGQFIGYAGRFRRAAANENDDAQSPAAREGARIRQLLHELRTPVNAIQGFAEVIQQQLFGPTPHEYRALAASIAGDSARILAGFDELDRLARLETGAIRPEEGDSDLAAAVAKAATQLQRFLAPRLASFEPSLPDAATPVALATGELDALLWRILATLAGSCGAGEHLALDMAVGEGRVVLACDLPLTLAAEEDIFAATTRPGSGALSAGAFGAGFALRLARAEAVAIGGALCRDEEVLRLELPLLTGLAGLPSAKTSRAGVAEVG